jgi:phthalate 4,5-dioxygenase oxygenase subunit
MGFDINIHDQFACESQGPIQDRTQENLGSSDKGIVLYRRLLVDAIRRNEAGETPPMVLDELRAREFTGPPTIDGIGPTQRMEEYWKESDAARRKKAAWSE